MSGRKKKASAAEVFGAHLRSLRKQAGLTQGDVAAAAGLTQTDISKIEAGLRWPSVPQLDAICAALGVPPEAVLPLPHAQ